jgi:pantetheine-phosphate adenylyltransferase
MHNQTPGVSWLKQYHDTFAFFGITSYEHLLVRWQEPHRFFHNLAHLRELLGYIEQSKLKGSEKHILIAAAFYHDAIYLPWRTDNEELSAALFEANCSQQSEAAAIVKQIILDTRTYEATHPLSALFCRFDTHILRHGSFVELLRWEAAIFKEYQCFDYRIYREARLKLLQHWTERYPENQNNLQSLYDYLLHYKPKIGVYPGSFNPFHKGHFNILLKAEQVFDKVIVARGVNPEKTDTLTQDSISPVLYYRQTEGFEGLLTDYLTSKEDYADVTLVRGLRNGDDLAYEMNQLQFMRDMKRNLKTVFFHCDVEYEHISSSALRNLEKIGKGYSTPYLPELPVPHLASFIEERFMT